METKEMKSVTVVKRLLRFFYCRKSKQYNEFEYGVYFNHTHKEVRIHNHEQILPESFECITTLTSKGEWIRRGILLAFAIAQKHNYKIVIGSEITNNDY